MQQSNSYLTKSEVYKQALDLTNFPTDELFIKTSNNIGESPNLD